MLHGQDGSRLTMYAVRDAEGKFVGRSRSAESAHRWSRRANMTGGSVSARAEGEDVPLSKVRVLYRDPSGTMSLWGIPYDMRERQSPRDLQRAYEQYVPPRPGHYGSKRIELGWTWLGSPGWWGSMSQARRAEVEDFLAWFKDAVPGGPGEFSVLPNEDNWPYKGDANRAGGSSSRNRARVRVDLHEVWAGGQLLYSGVNQSEARRTFVRAAIPNMHQFARALGLGQEVAYPPGLELRDVNSRGKTISSMMAATVEPHRMMKLHDQWNYVEWGGGRR